MKKWKGKTNREKKILQWNVSNQGSRWLDNELDESRYDQIMDVNDDIEMFECYKILNTKLPKKIISSFFLFGMKLIFCG